MRTIIKLRWFIIALWIAAAAVLMVTSPNMEQLVRDKGQIDVPDGYSSTIASGLLKQMSEDGGGTSAVLVFHRDNGLSESDLTAAQATLAKLAEEGGSYGVTGVTTHFEMQELKDQMVADDGRTVLSLLSVEFGDRTPAEARDALYEAVEGLEVPHYYTGGWLIGEDMIQSSQEGLKKTEYITVIFIMVILFLVFRSAVAPFIPLLSVGLSYIVAQSVVAFLVHYADFPLSNFTQIFMVAVLFGIGTDYCILLISRFKEELAHSDNKAAAIVETYRTAGKTVFVSGLAVLVGFTSIGFSTFVLYRSAVAVAVGVAVMLLVLVTVVPFFMATLGKVLFWPAKGSLEHKENKLWGRVGAFSLKRPVWTLVILAVILLPFLSTYKGDISFNSLNEIGDKYNSVKGFNIIADSFAPGETLPTTVVIESDQPFDTQAGLAAVEQASRALMQVDGVNAVRSATRPTGEPIGELRITEQIGTLGSGIVQTGDGLGQIRDGLAEASGQLSENAPKLQEAADGAGELVSGTRQLQSGIAQLGDGLRRIERGLRDGSAGAAELVQGLKQAKDSADQLHTASAELLAGYEQLGGGIGQLAAGYGEIGLKQRELAAGLQGVQEGLTGLGAKYPELQEDAIYLQLQGSVQQLQAGAEQLAGGLAQLNAQLEGAAGGLTQANAGFKQAAEGQRALAEGLGAIAAGLGELQQGLSQAAGGQGEIVRRLPQLTGGFTQLTEGQRQLQEGFAELGGQLAQLTDGLDQSVDGLTQVTDGLQEAQGYLDGLTNAPDQELTGWYLPEDALSEEAFQTALGVYVSDNRYMTKLDVILETNPYASESLDLIPELEAAVKRGLKGSPYENSLVAASGVTSMNNDLRTISAADYSRTVALMLAGISLILILLFRSLVIPVYIIISLLITYYTSMAITEVIYVRMLGLDGISWAVPFFAFVMLIALGVDYSIFLMDRFKEYKQLDPKEAILIAMRKMGTVIMSAALILGGTFAAMLPSGVMSLLQIATIVLCGLFLYSLVILPLFIPVMVRTFGEANWWPLMKNKDAEASAVRHMSSESQTTFKG